MVYQLIKRGFDVVLSTLILAFTWPLILAAVILVRLTSRGPVLYSQTRLGLNGTTFRISKIRSMYLNSEPNGAQWCKPKDPRVTPIGRILRASHIDELPQLFNILRGEMSLIGPRPERPEIAGVIERSLPDYRRRLTVRPGLSGLAQVLQPPDTDLSSVVTKLEYDVHYIRHQSLWLDCRIVVATVFHLAAVNKRLIARLFRFPDLARDGESFGTPSVPARACEVASSPASAW